MQPGCARTTQVNCSFCLDVIRKLIFTQSFVPEENGTTPPGLVVDCYWSMVSALGLISGTIYKSRPPFPSGARPVLCCEGWRNRWVNPFPLPQIKTCIAGTAPLHWKTFFALEMGFNVQKHKLHIHHWSFQQLYRIDSVSRMIISETIHCIVPCIYTTQWSDLFLLVTYIKWIGCYNVAHHNVLWYICYCSMLGCKW